MDGRNGTIEILITERDSLVRRLVLQERREQYLRGHRLSQHSMDIVFKLEAEQLGGALARRFGIDLPPVVSYFPTDLPVADVHLEQLDAVFELADGSLLHLEFQTVHRRETLTRFLLYDAYLCGRFDRMIHTVVIYGADVNVAEDHLNRGAIDYRVTNILLGQEDGEATLQRLVSEVERSGTLPAEDRLDLIFLPLMRHRQPRMEVMTQAVELAKRLPQEHQRQTLASLIGLGNNFLSQDEIEQLLEQLMTTSIGQLLIERGIEQGIERGRTVARNAVLAVLAKQFGAVPAEVSDRIARVDDLDELNTLHDRALAAMSLDEFSRDVR